MLQPNEKRIFKTLQQVKKKGKDELSLLGENIKDSYARKIMSSMNKPLGKGAVYRELGVWYLLPEYWDMPISEFRDRVILNEIKELQDIIKWTIPIAVVSLSLFITLVVLIIVN